MTADDIRILIERHGRRSSDGIFLADQAIGPLSEAILEALQRQRETEASLPVDRLNASNDR